MFGRESVFPPDKKKARPFLGVLILLAASNVSLINDVFSFPVAYSNKKLNHKDKKLLASPFCGLLPPSTACLQETFIAGALACNMERVDPNIFESEVPLCSAAWSWGSNLDQAPNHTLELWASTPGTGQGEAAGESLQRSKGVI